MPTRTFRVKEFSCYLAIAYAGGAWHYRTDESGSSLSWTHLASAAVDITVA